eukprot:SAG22_NODE_17858_length_297_cov_1.040404_1_plen_44_part_01
MPAVVEHPLLKRLVTSQLVAVSPPVRSKALSFCRASTIFLTKTV